MKTEISIDLWGGKRLSQLLTLFVAFALAPPVLHAQDWRRRDKAHDPTGLWLLRLPIDPIQREFLLFVFHQGGTLTGNFQGESAFDPTAVFASPGDPNYENNVLASPLNGVWQKTGSNTFAGMVVDMEYHNLAPTATTPPATPILQFARFQFTGRLTRSGDAMTFTALLTRYDPEGKMTSQTTFANGTGTRISLEILPNTSNTLPLPHRPSSGRTEPLHSLTFQ